MKKRTKEMERHRIGFTVKGHAFPLELACHRQTDVIFTLKISTYVKDNFFINKVINVPMITFSHLYDGFVNMSF